MGKPQRIVISLMCAALGFGVQTAPSASGAVAQAKLSLPVAKGVAPSGSLSRGLPVGTALRVHRGDLKIRRAGAIVDGVDVRGRLIIAAPNVTVRRSVVRGGVAPRRSIGLITIASKRARNFLVEDVTIRPSAISPNFDGVKVERRGTLRRLDVSGTVDGILIYGGKVTVEDSYLHDFRHFVSDPNQGGNASHDDAIQILAGRGHRIVGNTLTGAFNAAVMVTQDDGVTGDLLLANNMIDQGGCSVNFGSQGHRMLGLTVTGNSFGGGQRVKGCAIIRAKRKSRVASHSNVWAATGLPVRLNRGR